MSLLLALTASGGASYTLTCDAGSYSLAGQDAAFSVAMPASAGSYAVSGQSALFSISKLLNTGLYSVSGQSALFSVSIQADAGAYSIQGQDADLVYSVSGYSLECDAGAYSLQGQPVQFSVTGIGHSHDPHRYDFTLDLDVTRRKKPVEAQEIPEPIVLEPEALGGFQELEPVEDVELVELQQYSEKIKTLIDEAKTEYERIEAFRIIQDENKLNDEEMAIVLCIAELL